MKCKLLLVALVLSLSVPAAGQFRLITKGYEVALKDVRLPQSTSGTISYKECMECAVQTTRVNGETVWLINEKPLTLKTFRERMASVRDREETVLTVMRHLESNLITEVSVEVR